MDERSIHFKRVLPLASRTRTRTPTTIHWQVRILLDSVILELSKGLWLWELSLGGTFKIRVPCVYVCVISYGKTY